MILVLDAYDSFVQTLARYIREAGFDTHVQRADEQDAASFLALKPKAVFLSPGPKRPVDSPTLVEVCRCAPESLPIFGVCLGHQCIIEAFGGRTDRADQPVHGRASPLRHTGDPLFDGIPRRFTAGRYHSLIGTLQPGSPLRAIAWTEDHAVMAVRHVARPIVGVQFHPESILTPNGRRMIDNFLRDEVG